MSTNCDWCDGEGCEECTGGKASSDAAPAAWGCEMCDGAGCDACQPSAPTELDFPTKIENLIYEGDEAYRSDKQSSLEAYQQVIDLITNYSADKDGDCDEEKLTSELFKARKFVAILSIEMKKPEAEYQAAIQSFLNLIFGSSRGGMARQNETFESVDKLLIAAQRAGGDIQTRVFGLIRSVLGKPDASMSAGAASAMARLLFKVNSTLAVHHISAVQAAIAAGTSFAAEQRAAEEVLEIMHASCKLPSGQDDVANKKTELLDLYALKTQLFMATQDPAHDDAAARRIFFTDLYERTHPLVDGVCEAKSLSVLKECWGKMRANEGLWDLAKIEFFDAFQNYGSAGRSNEARRCVKYIQVATMLADAQAAARVAQLQAQKQAAIDLGVVSALRESPDAAKERQERQKSAQISLDSPELKEYRKDPEVMVITNLRDAFESNDVDKWNQNLAEVNASKDTFLIGHLENMVRDFQKKAIKQMVAPYSRVYFSFIANQLKITVPRVEQLLVQLVLDEELTGRLDQVSGLVDLGQRSDGAAKKYRAIENWSQVLSTLCANLPQPGSSSIGRGLGMADVAW